MKALSMVLMLSAMPALSQWSQSKFMIGSWGGFAPVYDGFTDAAQLTKYANANFNLMLYGNWWYENNYMLNLMASMNSSAGTTRMQGIFFDNELSTKIEDYDTLTGARKNAFMGFRTMDEPTHSALNTGITNINSYQSSYPDIMFSEPLAIYRAGSPAPFQTDWDNLEQNYVANFAYNVYGPSPLMLTYYVMHDWSENGSYPTAQEDYSFYNLDQLSYYRSLALFSSYAGYSGRPFWGTPNGTTYYIVRQLSPVLGKEEFSHNEARLRFNAYSYVTYGARGLVWFTYDTPQNHLCPNPPTLGCENYITAAEDNTNIYNWMQAINGEILKLGPTLMQLAWRTTVHGSSTDPRSGETDLPDNAYWSRLAWGNGGIPSDVAVGVFEHTGGNWTQVLGVFNKSVINSKTNMSLFVNSRVKPFIYNKSTGEPNLALHSYDAYNDITTVTLNLAPGDMQLVSVPGVNSFVPATTAQRAAAIAVLR